MKPAPFEYVAPTTIEDALEAMQEFDSNARFLAGGQSLVPLLSMRVMRPEGIIDLNGISGLDEIHVNDEKVRIGAMTRYTAIETSSELAAHLPLLVKAVRRVADRQVRNRGTLGGSICHAEPAAQMPLCAVALGAELLVASTEGRRVIAADAFFQHAYTTALAPHELLLEIVFPSGRGTMTALAQHTRRHGDFPLVSVAAVGRAERDGTWHDLRLGLGGVADHPICARSASAFLEGKALYPETVKTAATFAIEAIDPPSDSRASAEYRRHLAPIYVERALNELMNGGVHR